ncbi:lysM domain receptor-like kinase 3 [Iris pallida]|uniref:LysM domain receptor-like kinase 3 n=1 Tax=Iris pallida TaxID=29817 RepID=A0AAX6HTP9_IRIPA|nr:lysM domain receptor-like kinase 3 [Iris pallida]
MELAKILFLIVSSSLFPRTRCFDLLPMRCNVSLTDSCPAALHFAPHGPTSAAEAAALFNVPPGAVRRTADGFLVAVTCGCPAEHREFVWETAYAVRNGDAWGTVEERFGLLLLAKPGKRLIEGTNVTLNFLCGCVGGGSSKVVVVTYVIRPGDTLYTISLRFRVDMYRIVKLNNVSDSSKIYVGDRLFIPAEGLDHLIVPDGNDSSTKRTFNSRSRILLGVATAVITIMFILFFLLLRRYYMKKRKNICEASVKGTKSSKFFSANVSHTSKSSPVLSAHSLSKASSKSFEPVKKRTVFPYSEVSAATSNFSESQKVGQGSYGSVYRGKLRGVVVAVKQMKDTKSKEFFAEVNVLCKVYHDNLIELIGYSAGAESLFLIYEFAQNGALSDHLHNPAAKGYKPLSWTLRVQIALDAAKGLEHLHAHVKPFYVHRDVKTSNILLDSDFRAKIADFGLAKLLEHSPDVGAVTSKIVGTFGYLAPEYVRDGCVTPKSDVYAFGVVLMELITGQHALTRAQSLGSTEYPQRQSVVDFVLSALEDEHETASRLAEKVDPNLVHYHNGSLLQMALLSKDCVDDDWRRRPDMTQVVLRLSKIAGFMNETKPGSITTPTDSLIGRI